MEGSEVLGVSLLETAQPSEGGCYTQEQGHLNRRYDESLQKVPQKVKSGFLGLNFSRSKSPSHQRSRYKSLHVPSLDGSGMHSLVQ